jgi:hypothetical protein
LLTTWVFFIPGVRSLTAKPGERVIGPIYAALREGQQWKPTMCLVIIIVIKARRMVMRFYACEMHRAVEADGPT